jgi:hypothetical protein
MSFLSTVKIPSFFDRDSKKQVMDSASSAE